MDILSDNDRTILDLPNEMLLTIFNKLNMVDVLYSLVDVNEQSDRLALDPLYIQNLDMTIKPLLNCASSLDNQVLERICEKILPRIHHQVNEISVEQCSMTSILHTVNYPQLYSLSLVNFQEEILFQYLTDDSTLRDLLTRQVTHLKIDIHKEPPGETFEALSNIIVLLLSLCKRLVNLNFCQLSSGRTSPICIYKLPFTSCMSSTLTKLNINTETFDDCLSLLDGRLHALSTLIISITKISFTLPNIDNTKKLPKLKCFSLTSMTYTYYYDSRIIPLLGRMINLEELTLFLSVVRVNSTYVDGIQLYDDILIYMPRLHKFTFSINTGVLIKNMKIELSSNENIQHSFIERGRYGQVGLYADTRLKEAEGRCQVYSLPYQFEYLLHLTNSFQGDMFDKVRILLMNDILPFEH